MKKNYFLMAAAAAMFAACSETDMVNAVNEAQVEAQNAISFEAFAGKATRAEYSNTNLPGSFAVWGWKTAAATPNWSTGATQVFNKVVATKNGAVYDYANKVYWDKTSTYKFFAVAPGAEPTGVTYTISGVDGFITINGAESAKAAASEDYLITRAAKEQAGTLSTKPVQFGFHHTMSKVSFVVANSLTDKQIVITSLTMTKWNDSKGKFVQTSNVAPNEGKISDFVCGEWSLADNVMDGAATLIGTGASETTVTLNAGASQTLTDSYIFVPQTITATLDAGVPVDGLTFTLTYMIGTEEFEDHVGILPTQVWGTDMHTTYTINVGPDAITFGEPTVCAWEPNNATGGTSIQ